MARYEEKYILDSSVKAGFFVADVDALLRSFRFSYTSYKVESIYFDYPNLEFLFQKQAGEWAKNKFRLRRYPKTGDLFWERKSKLNSMSFKTRAPVNSRDLKEIEADIFNKWGLIKTCFVSYTRQVWVMAGEEAKFNIDTDVSGFNFVSGEEFSLHDIVAEFKYLNTVDVNHAFIKAMFERHGLKKSSFSKYFFGMTRGNI